MGMRVVKVGTRTIQHFKFINPSFTFGNCVHWMTIGKMGYMHPMPMGDASVFQFIAEVDAHFLALLQTQHRAEITAGYVGESIGRAFDDRAVIFLHIGQCAGQNANRSRFCHQFKFHVSVKVGGSHRQGFLFHGLQPTRYGIQAGQCKT